jgi:hypothetical protein
MSLVEHLGQFCGPLGDNAVLDMALAGPAASTVSFEFA